MIAPARPAPARCSAHRSGSGASAIEETTASSPDEATPRMISTAHGLSSAVKTRSTVGPRCPAGPKRANVAVLLEESLDPGAGRRGDVRLVVDHLRDRGQGDARRDGHAAQLVARPSCTMPPPAVASPAPPSRPGPSTLSRTPIPVRVDAEQACAPRLARPKGDSRSQYDRITPIDPVMCITYVSGVIGIIEIFEQDIGPTTHGPTHSKGRDVPCGCHAPSPPSCWSPLLGAATLAAGGSGCRSSARALPGPVDVDPARVRQGHRGAGRRPPWTWPRCQRRHVPQDHGRRPSSPASPPRTS